MKFISHNMGFCLSSRQQIAELKGINSMLRARLQVVEESQVSLAELASSRLEILKTTRGELDKAVCKNVRLDRDNVRIGYERDVLKLRLGRRI